MQIKSRVGAITLLLVVLALFTGCQQLDAGLQYAKSHVKSHPTSIGMSEAPRYVISLRARYEKSQTTYWLLSMGNKGSSFKRAQVFYNSARQPIEAQALESQ